MANIPIDAQAVDLKIKNGTDQFIEIDGIQEMELSVDKDDDDIRTLGDLWQKMMTTQVGLNISIGGYFKEDEDTGTMDEGQAELFPYLYSGDDVAEFQISVPGADEVDGEIEADFRVSDGSESTSFAEKVDWSATLQSHGDPEIGST